MAGRRVVLRDGTARAALRAVVGGAMPVADDHRRQWAVVALDAAEVAGAPAWVRVWWHRAAVDPDPWCLLALAAWCGTAAWLGGWREGQVMAGAELAGWPLPRARWWAAVCAGCTAEDRAEPWGGWPSGTWTPGDGWQPPLTRHLRPEGRPVELPEWWARQGRAVAGCMRLAVVYDTPGHGAVAVLTPCRSRRCWFCARRTLRTAVFRYAPMFAVPLRAGWRREMFTVGNALDGGFVADRHELARWRRAVRRLTREMERGVAECAILPRTWAAGMTAVELVPRAVGAYVHAHIVAVRRAWYPYGWSERQWRERGAPPRAGRWTPSRVAGCLTAGDVDRWALRHPRFRDAMPERERRELAAAVCLGVREVCRRAGVGEVCDASVLDDAAAAGSYVAKVQAYVAKAERDRGAERACDRADVQWMARATRRVEPWGDLRGLWAGPDRSEREGRVVGWLAVVGDEAEPVGFRGSPEAWSGADVSWGVGVDCTRVQYMRRERLVRWAEWADVDALQAFLGHPAAVDSSA